MHSCSLERAPSSASCEHVCSNTEAKSVIIESYHICSNKSMVRRNLVIGRVSTVVKEIRVRFSAEVVE